MYSLDTRLIQKDPFASFFFLFPFLNKCLNFTIDKLNFHIYFEYRLCSRSWVIVVNFSELHTHTLNEPLGFGSSTKFICGWLNECLQSNVCAHEMRWFLLMYFTIYYNFADSVWVFFEKLALLPIAWKHENNSRYKYYQTNIKQRLKLTLPVE